MLAGCLRRISTCKGRVSLSILFRGISSLAVAVVASNNMRLNVVTLGIASALAASIVLASGGCGDGPDAPKTPSAGSPYAASPGAINASFGPAPKLEKAVVALFPDHGTSVTRDQLAIQNPLGRTGVCFSGSFTGLAEQARSFRMTVDGKEATLQFEWTVPAPDNPRPPRACYLESAKLAVGRHKVGVTVRASGSPAEPVLQEVNWEFDIK